MSSVACLRYRISLLSRSGTPQVRERVAAAVSFTHHPRNPSISKRQQQPTAASITECDEYLANVRCGEKLQRCGDTHIVRSCGKLQQSDCSDVEKSMLKGKRDLEFGSVSSQEQEKFLSGGQNLHDYLSRETRRALQGECMAQRKLSEAEMERDRLHQANHARYCLETEEFRRICREETDRARHLRTDAVLCCCVLCCVVAGVELCWVVLCCVWSSTASSGKANDRRNRGHVVLDLFSNLKWVRSKGFFC